MNWLRRTCGGEIAGALIAVPLVMTGIALPLDFICNVDGYLKIFSSLELTLVYAWGFALYFLIGAAIALTAILPASALAILFRRPVVLWAGRLGAWLALSIVLLVLLRGTKLWFEANEWAIAGWISWIKWELAVIATGGCAVWAWRHSRMPLGLSSLATLMASAGFVVTLAALASWAITPAPRPVGAMASQAASARAVLPNIVLITIDTLAADHMSLYGYYRPTTPNLDALAEGASVFERFYANSNYTAPSISSIIHGMRPWTHRVLQQNAVPDSVTARQGLVARLKSAGYYTMSVSTNWLAGLNRSETGFDVVMDTPINDWASGIFFRYAYANSATGLGMVQYARRAIDWSMAIVGANSEPDHFDPERALSAARNLMQQTHVGSPYFLWVHLLPPHDPYATPAPFLGQFDPGPQARTRFNSSPPWLFRASADETFPDRLVGRYDESITYVDHHLGRFMEWLKERGLLNDSLLVISADHGESFVKGYGGHTGPLLHDGLIRVPLIIKEPRQNAGKRLKVLSEHIDLMPTILDIVGAPIAGQVEGRSLKPAIEGKDMSGAVFSMNFEESNRFGALDTGTVAMIDGRWKYTHYIGKLKYPMMPRLEDSLHDLQADSDEKANLLAVRPAVADKMLDEIRARLRQYGRPRE